MAAGRPPPEAAAEIAIGRALHDGRRISPELLVFKVRPQKGEAAALNANNTSVLAACGIATAPAWQTRLLPAFGDSSS